MKEHQIEGVPLSKWRRLKEMKDRRKRFRVCFVHDECAAFSTFHNTLRAAKGYIVGLIRDQGVLFDLSSIAIYDQYEDDRLVKLIDGNRLYKRYFRI